LAKAGFASNRGLIMVSVLLGLYLQFDRRQGRDFDFSFLSQWLPDLSNPYVMTAAVIAAGILGLVLLRVLGVGWYILRFFGYRLRLSGEELKISCGLFTKVSATVPRKRIQFISIHSNFVSRLLGLSSIRIETAGGASSENENATTTVSRRWFIPVIPTRDVPEMIGTLRPGLQWQPDQYDWQPLSHQAGRRMVRIAVLVSVLLAPIGYYFFEIWGCRKVAL
jgi:putative membrane protein